VEHLFKRCGMGAGALLCLLSATVAADEAAGSPERRVEISEYVVRGNSVLDAQAIEEAVYPYLGPDKTLADLEGAREALQKSYQDRGYQSVYVELPEQRVEGGVVYLQVTETKVGRVRVVGAKHYSPLEIREQVPALEEGKVPDFEQVQQELASLNRTDNRQVVPVVREGRRPGTMDVDLQVEDKQPWTLTMGLNNEHSADTESLRSSVSLGYNNLWQAGHSASLTWDTAPENRDNSEVWSVAYVAPLNERWTLQFSGYQSDSDVGTVGGTNVLGKGHSYGVSAIYNLPGVGAWAQSLSMGVDVKNFDEKVLFGMTDDEAPLKYVPFTLGYSGYRYTEHDQLSLGLSLVVNTRSIFGYGSDDVDFAYKRYLADPSFAVLKGDGEYSFDFAGSWQSASKLAFQLATGPLVSNEQITAGGVGTVRGYLSAEQSGDDGVVLSQELRTPSLGRYVGSYIKDWRFYAFAEGAHLRLQDPLPEQQDNFTLASVGIGTRATLNDWLSGTLDWAVPLKDGPETKKNDPRVHFSVQATF